MIDQKLSPNSQQLSTLASTLKDVSATTEMAMEIGLTVQEETKLLQWSEQQLLARVAMLETHVWATNLKFCSCQRRPNLMPT